MMIGAGRFIRAFGPPQETAVPLADFIEWFDNILEADFRAGR
jgi:hypothetical protein